MFNHKQWAKILAQTVILIAEWRCNIKDCRKMAVLLVWDEGFDWKIPKYFLCYLANLRNVISFQ